MSQTATAIQKSLRFSAPHWRWAVALHATWSFLILKRPFHSSVSNLTSPSAVAAKLRGNSPWEDGSLTDDRFFYIVDSEPLDPCERLSVFLCRISQALLHWYYSLFVRLPSLQVQYKNTGVFPFILPLHSPFKDSWLLVLFFFKLLFSRFVKVKAAHLALDVVLTSDTIDWFLSHSDSNKIAVHCG